MDGDDQFESDGNPQPPAADSDATGKCLVSGASSGSVGFDQTAENPNFDGTDRCHEKLKEFLLTKLDSVYNEAIDKLPQPPVADSDATSKFLVSGSSSGSVGLDQTSENPNFDGTDRCHEKIKEMLLTKLDSVYNEAIDKLVALGYDEGVAKKAILTRGRCYGSMDALTNVLHNALDYLNSPEGQSNESKPLFDNPMIWREFSLGCLVCSLRLRNPSLSRGDALWCLLMSDLHVVRAGAMELPVFQNPNIKVESSVHEINNVEKVNNDSVGVTAASEETSQGDIGFPKRPELSPTQKMLLKSNVALFAAEYRANLKSEQALPSGDSSSTVDTEGEAPDYTEGSLEIQDDEGAEMMLKKFRDLNLEGDSEFVPEDEKDEMLLSLVHEIKDLEREVKERKEWAHQKAIQAARKLSHDLNELKMLRMERERKQAEEDSLMKRLSEMESTWRKASCTADCENVAVIGLEYENAEIRAEIEASKLSASESVTVCLEVARREKKSLKKLLAWENRRAKLQDDITAEKQRIMELQEELLQVEAARKTAQTELMQDQKAKELAYTQVEEERRLKGAAEADNKRKHATLRSKIELDFQRYKDDLQRLEQELSRIKMSNDPDQHPQTGTIASLLSELDEDDREDEIDRACVFCLKDEAFVVFLPCAHQVLCAGCNDEYVEGRCPTCRVPIDQRIRVFG